MMAIHSAEAFLPSAELSSGASILRPGDRFLSRRDVEKALHRGRQWIYDRLSTDPDFPKPVHLGRSILFIESEVLAWANARIAESRARAA